MRWLLTRDTPLAAALAAAGQGIVPHSRNKPLFVDSYIATKDIARSSAGAYPIKSITATRQTEWDVLVLVDPIIGNFGYSKRVAVKWNKTRGKILVMQARNDPRTWGALGSKGPTGSRATCVCRPTDIAVYISNDARIVAASGTKRRSVLWRPGMPVGPVVAAVAHALQGKTYTPPKAPKRGRGHRGR